MPDSIQMQIADSQVSNCCILIAVSTTKTSKKIIKSQNSFHENNKFETYEILFQFGQFRMIAFQSHLISITLLQRNVTRLYFHLL